MLQVIFKLKYLKQYQLPCFILKGDFCCPPMIAPLFLGLTFKKGRRQSCYPWSWHIYWKKI